MFYFKEIKDRKIISFGCQNIEPCNVEIISESEYIELKAESENQKKVISEYAEKVKNEEMTIEEVPEEYRDEVEFIVNPPEPDPEQAVVDSIMQEVSSYGY